MKCGVCDHINLPDTLICEQCGTVIKEPHREAVQATVTAETPQVAFPVGQQIGERYRIEEELGQGGMGRVYRAYDLEINESIALKVLNPEISGDEKTITRFRNELKLARRITHKNVCRLHDLGSWEGSHFISMEYVSGENLKNLVQESGRLTPERAAAVLEQICAGLAEAHKIGVIHRDLKPQNIMIDHSGDARIMDFGIAISRDTSGMTEAGMLIGTPQYMAPEQLEGGQVDHRSDIYALGTILYEMLTGEPLFTGKTPFSIARQHKDAEALDLRTIDPGTPGHLVLLMQTCLAEDPNDRYQSVQEVLHALQSSGETTGRRPASKNKKRFMLLTAVLVTAAAVVAVIWFGRRDTPSGWELPVWTNSIAVLPFENLTGGTEQDHIYDGMTVQLISNLNHIQELKVPARTSMMAYKNTGKDIRLVARELDVQNILEGSVRKAGNRIRITVQLIEAKSGASLWAKDFDYELNDIFAIQDEVARSVVEALRIRLTPQAVTRIKTPQPQDVSAYDMYLMSRHVIDNQYLSTQSEEDFQKALDYALRAVQIDPKYALGYINLGYLYEIRSVMTDDPEDLEKEFQYMRKGYDLDPDLDLSNAGMGQIHTRRMEPDQAFPFIKRALNINPNGYEICLLAGNFFQWVGLTPQAIALFSRAIALEPLGLYAYTNRGAAHLFLGDLEEAERDLRRALEIQPNYPFPNGALALTLTLQGQYREAGEILKRWENEPASEILFKWTRAVFLAAQGQKDLALATHRNSYVYAVLGKTDEAIAQISEDTVAYPWLVFYLTLENMPIYNGIRQDPRFQEVLAKKKSEHLDRLRKFSLD